MAVIFWLSSARWSAENTGSVIVPLLQWLLPWATPVQLAALHGLARKAAHLTEYGILGALWYRAFVRGASARPGVAGWTAFGIAVGWAIVDEVHQSTTATRTASTRDVVLDAVGALLAIVAMQSGWRAIDRATAILLWLAAIGGAAVLAINWAAGVPSGIIWATVAAAIALLAVRRVWR
jgi:VanZ family protein